MLEGIGENSKADELTDGKQPSISSATNNEVSSSTTEMETTSLSTQISGTSTVDNVTSINSTTTTTTSASTTSEQMTKKGGKEEKTKTTHKKLKKLKKKKTSNSKSPRKISGKNKIWTNQFTPNCQIYPYPANYSQLVPAIPSNPNARQPMYSAIQPNYVRHPYEWRPMSNTATMGPTPFILPRAPSMNRTTNSGRISSKRQSHEPVLISKSECQIISTTTSNQKKNSSMITITSSISTATTTSTCSPVDGIGNNITVKRDLDSTSETKENSTSKKRKISSSSKQSENMEETKKKEDESMIENRSISSTSDVRYRVTSKSNSEFPVKILTHIIDGFLIREHPIDPFPVNPDNIRAMNFFQNGTIPMDSPKKKEKNKKEKKLIKNEKLEEKKTKKFNSESAGDPSDWTIHDVCRYVENVLRTNEFEDQLLKHEIDGNALMLLETKHLTDVLQMRLGPALKLSKNIQGIKILSSP
ncbi:hypothetical protein SNEBB_009374 [Seison nebaliae]|nr:hypothetical protein SNEBB_009374 [Seison nebaliae]